MNQERVSQPYTEAQCLADGGVYENKRLYLKDDQDNNNLKDYSLNGETFHLKDNMLYFGDPSVNRRLALVLSRGIALE